MTLVWTNVPGPWIDAVDVALGREMDHRARPVLGEQAVEQAAVADVAVHEHVSRVAVQARQAFPVAGIGQRVEVDDGFAALRPASRGRNWRR